jgi:hypothetical protein
LTPKGIAATGAADLPPNGLAAAGAAALTVGGAAEPEAKPFANGFATAGVGVGTFFAAGVAAALGATVLLRLLEKEFTGAAADLLANGFAGAAIAGFG